MAVLHSEGSPQAGEVGKEESQEVQQGGGQSPAHGEEQEQAPVHTGAGQPESSLVEKDLWVLVKSPTKGHKND